MQKIEQIVTVGQDGKWALQLENNFDLGFHAYIVESLETGLKDVGFFMIRQIAKVVEVIEAPMIFSFAIAVLLALVIFQAWYAVRLDRNIKACENKDERFKLKHQQAHTHKTIFFSSLAVVVALVVVFSINRQYNLSIVPDRVEKASESVQEMIIPTVSGAVISPLTMQPQPSVDLTAKDVTVKTSTSGRYNFNQLDISAPLKITHPNLRRELAYYLHQGENEIFFDASMYNYIISEMEKADPDFMSAQVLEVKKVSVNDGLVEVEVAGISESYKLKVNDVGEWQQK